MNIIISPNTELSNFNLEKVVETANVQNIDQLKDYIKEYLNKSNFNGLVCINVSFNHHTCIVNIHECHCDDLYRGDKSLIWFYNINKRQYIDKLSDYSTTGIYENIEKINKLIKIYNVLDECTCEEVSLIDFMFNEIFGFPSIFDRRATQSQVDMYDKIHDILISTDLTKHIKNAIDCVIGDLYEIRKSRK
jgi:hypothetical protein